VLALAIMQLSCARMLPWSREPVGAEVNLAFTLEKNLIRLSTVRIDNRPGHFILGSAAPRTIVDSRFPLHRFRAHALQMNQRETVRIDPAPANLGGVTDAIVGVDAWRNRAVSIDYRTGLLTWQKEGIKSGLMHIYRFPAEPMINVFVDGREVAAVVDTTSPDTLVLPGPDARGTVNVRIGATDFGAVDVQYADVSQARVGNRLLSRFLVTIDYGRKVVGLWRDPRTPLREPPPAATPSPATLTPPAPGGS
jgi:hypothetical protein